jgi:hypothetical protein
MPAERRWAPAQMFEPLPALWLLDNGRASQSHLHGEGFAARLGEKRDLPIIAERRICCFPHPVTIRRWTLVMLLALLVATAARRSGASTPVEVELAAYDGRASGGWACGPTASVRYGGLGGVVRLHSLAASESAERSVTVGPSARSGLAVTVGAAGEGRSFTLLGCATRDCSGAGAIVPPGGIVGAAMARLGYDSEYVGFHGGALVWQRFANNTDTRPTWQWVPELLLRVGRLERFHADLGLGSYDVPTLLRPGAYLGVVWAPTSGWECALHAGIHEVFDGELGVRGSLGFKAPLAERLQLGVTIAASSGAFDEIEPEGQLVFVVHL